MFPRDEDTPESPYDVIGGKGSVQNYGVLEYDPAGGGVLTLRLVGPDGAELAAHAVRAEDLR